MACVYVRCKNFHRHIGWEQIKLSVNKMGNKTPSGVYVGYIIVVEVKCYFCLGWELAVNPSLLSFSAYVSQPEADCDSNCRR